MADPDACRARVRLSGNRNGRSGQSFWIDPRLLRAASCNQHSIGGDPNADANSRRASGRGAF